MSLCKRKLWILVAVVTMAGSVSASDQGEMPGHLADSEAVVTTIEPATDKVLTDVPPTIAQEPAPQTAGESKQPTVEHILPNIEQQNKEPNLVKALSNVAESTRELVAIAGDAMEQQLERVQEQEAEINQMIGQLKDSNYVIVDDVGVFQNRKSDPAESRNTQENIYELVGNNPSILDALLAGELF